jgi:hypothetical protein
MLLEARELTENAKVITLTSQEIEEGAQTKAKSPDALLGRVPHLESEMLALRSTTLTQIEVDLTKFEDSTDAFLARVPKIEAEVPKLDLTAKAGAQLEADLKTLGDSTVPLNSTMNSFESSQKETAVPGDLCGVPRECVFASMAGQLRRSPEHSDSGY